MSTPTDQQRMRANLRKAMTNIGADDAAALAIRCAVDILGEAHVMDAALDALPLDARTVHLNAVETTLRNVEAQDIPELMGTAEVAAAFGIANSNISKLPKAVRPCPVARISNGTTPVYLASEVTAKAAQYRPRTRATA